MVGYWPTTTETHHNDESLLSFLSYFLSNNHGRSQSQLFLYVYLYLKMHMHMKMCMKICNFVCVLCCVKLAMSRIKWLLSANLWCT